MSSFILSVQAKQHIKNAKIAKDYIETPDAFKNSLMKVYESLGKTKQIEVNAGVDGNPYNVTINISTVEKVISAPNVSAEKLAVLKNADAILKNSVYVESSKTTTKSGGKKVTVQHDYFEAPVTLGRENSIARFDVTVSKSAGKNVVTGINVVKAPETAGRPNTIPDSASNRSTDEISRDYINQMHQVLSSVTADNSTSTLANGRIEGYNGSGVPDVSDGAGNSLNFKSWDDFKSYIKDVGKDIHLTLEQKVQKIQKAYDGIADKTDINIPISDKYLKGFTTDGRVDYNWPKYLGLAKETIRPITRSNMLPEIWDRYGPMSGSNFSDVPPDGRYSYGKRSIPYVENEEAYHSGKFNNTTYFDKIDAIRSGDLDALNEILKSEGIPPVSESYFEDLMEKYNDFIKNTANEVGTYVDATYGIKGKAAAWGDFGGGAGQIITPLKGIKLVRLGIIIGERL